MKRVLNAYTLCCDLQHYENYSFEELRLASPSVKGDSEKLTMEAQGNGTYVIHWTPMAIGYYDIKIEVDGYPLTRQVSGPSHDTLQ